MTSITGRLSQFCLFPLTQTNRDKKKEIYKHSCKHFKAENFLNDQNIDWNQVLNIEKKLIDKSFDKFLNIFQLLSDTYTSKKTLQCYTKCFIQTMETKTKKFQESKIHNKKKNYDEFNRYKNYIDILTRKNKWNHYLKFFQEQKNKWKIWDGIKSIININKMSKNSINCLKINRNKETNRATLHDSLNNFFVTVAQNVEAKLVHTDKHYFGYLTLFFWHLHCLEKLRIY